PLFVFFLSLAGIVSWKQLLKFGRYFTVLAFVLAAVLTPSTDMFSQVMLGAPLVILYFVAVGLAYLFGAKSPRPSRFTAPAAGLGAPAPKGGADPPPKGGEDPPPKGGALPPQGDDTAPPPQGDAAPRPPMSEAKA